MESNEVVYTIRYGVTKEEIQAAAARYAALVPDSPGNYEVVRLAIQDLRTKRTAVEKRRVELKANALDYGRRVDAVAKDLTALIRAVEDPLQARKDVVDAEKERIRAAKAEAERLALEAVARAAREAEETKLRLGREAEEARLRAEVEAFEERQRAFAEERKRIEEAQRVEAERQRKEAELIKAEVRKLEEARVAAERAEAARVARIEAEKEAAERLERERVEAERMKPDLEKLEAYVAALQAVPEPELTTPEGTDMLARIRAPLDSFAVSMETFGDWAVL